MKPHVAFSAHGPDSLPSDVVHAGNRRLSIAAVVYASVWAAVFAAGQFSHSVLGMPDMGEFGSMAFQWTLAGVSIFGSLLIAWLVRGGRLGPARCCDLGLVFHVLGAATIVVSEASSPPPEGAVLFGISWATTWIIWYPVVVPTTPVRSTVGTLLAAATGPAMVGINALRGLPPLSPMNLFWWIVPFPICAGMGIAAARIVHGLGREVARARELGSYRLVERLGKGGMGEVWRAEHRFLARPAAIKLVRPETLAGGGDAGDAAIKRFEREATLTAGLRCPHTIALYDYGHAADGSLYYAMELLEGMDLETMVKRFGPIPAPRAVFLLQQAARSLAEAHAAGLVHRDVKPANVFVCRLGLEHDFVKVLDFGLVKPPPSQRDAKLTADGVASGTPAFMAPEVVTGTSEVDARADLYSLGCVTYWMLTGQLVFEGTNALKILADHVHTPPVPPSQRTELELPPDLDRLVLALLEKAPERRPASALEVLRRLEDANIGERWSAADAAEWWTTHQPRSHAAGVMPSSTADVAERAA